MIGIHEQHHTNNTITSQINQFQSHQQHKINKTNRVILLKRLCHGHSWTHKYNTLLIERVCTFKLLHSMKQSGGHLVPKK